MNKKITSDKGSIWRKWDLHIHTPNTKLNDNFRQVGEEEIWKTYSDKIENSDVSAFGITDYFSCENYFTFLEEFGKHYPDSNKVFFPNIEFRLDISVNQHAEEVNVHIIFSNQLTKNQIDDFLSGLKTNLTNTSGAKISCKNLEQDQFVSATINHNQLLTCLYENFGKEKPYLIIAAANNSGLRPLTKSPRKLAITDEIDKICDGFFGGRQNVEYYLDTDRYETDEIAKPRPVICGCDAHSFDDIDNHLGKYVTRESSGGKVEIYKDVTWIKADLTFEGLKQIKYEPLHRVSISENEPRKPVRRVESIKFNFPSNTFIQRKNSSEQQDFCLKNLKQPIHFSDYFTCIIGGRGTGKSTIINILAEKLNEKTVFFDRSNLKINGSDYVIENDPSSYIEIVGTNEIEFVSQGKIEKLAEANELTRLIFEERIKELESEFLQIESEYEHINSKIDENIRILFNLISNSKTKREKTKEKETIQKVIDSINDERYIAITGRIKTLKQELTSIENSKRNYNALLTELRTITQNYKESDTKNAIDERIQEIISTLIGLDELTSVDDQISYALKEFDAVNSRVEEINGALVTEAQNLRAFFQEKGTNEDTIKDSQKASDTLSRITSDLQNIATQDARLKSAYKENEEIINGLSSLYDRNNALISTNLSEINNKLKINDENVLDINFTYGFDEDDYKSNLFREFYNLFSSYHISGTSDSRVKEVLFLIEPSLELLDTTYSSFSQRLDNLLTENNYRRDNNYVKIVTEVFSNKGNYLIYLNLIRKHRYNLSKYLKINGFYGSRELESCSFGQRCTAVIVTLLMTGVKPLIIDEPEAHLDNKLVADYLVGLVKEKQFDRQVIFASHNSNFVINGDSALIHILEIPNNSIYTQKTSTTIENIQNREKLLKLEGGREAFLNRENKYGI
ncbi:TrlF family AAA-like ATPase [Robiginitalea marina]|uniref:AAA family ATPase n=1 Tax=Robiginitalea marina TaxID=2954105 RepID=A0ABT1ATG2_9FLAO|nr:AAA family ATPase [Robiginitalea marina]MCO5723226.1 AAA family ATPase [Robiginitalea marina]